MYIFFFLGYLTMCRLYWKVQFRVFIMMDPFTILIKKSYLWSFLLFIFFA